jgi:hypothetical protein
MFLHNFLRAFQMDFQVQIFLLRHGTRYTNLQIAMSQWAIAADELPISEKVDLFIFQ